MARRPVITYPDPVLRSPAEPVSNIDGKLQSLIDDMAETMYSAPGIGLASNQVGEPCRLFIFDISPKDQPRKLVVVINPKIVEREGSVTSEEGCLSVVDYSAEVKRAQCITVEGLDREGNPITIREEGLGAVVLQHEIDHLDGTLFIDHLSRLKRELYKRRLRRALQQE